MRVALFVLVAVFAGCGPLVEGELELRELCRDVESRDIPAVPIKVQGTWSWDSEWAPPELSMPDGVDAQLELAQVDLIPGGGLGNLDFVNAADVQIARIDGARIGAIAWSHDPGEARVGDLTPHDGVTSSDKHQRERDAVREILAGLPRGADYLALWEDYETGTSTEARLVKQADRLEMALQATVYRMQAGLPVEDFFNSARAAIRDPRLQTLLAELESLNGAGEG